jgi:hypothetical protein
MIAAGMGPQPAGQHLHRATSRAAQLSAAARGHRRNIACTEQPIMMTQDVLPPVLSSEVIVVDRVPIRRGWPGRALPLLAGDGGGPR